MGFVLAFLIIWIPCGIYAGVTADDKGHGAVSWFFGGLIFGPIALIAVAGLGDRKLRHYQKELAIKKQAPIDKEELRQRMSAVEASLAQRKMDPDRETSL